MLLSDFFKSVFFLEFVKKVTLFFSVFVCFFNTFLIWQFSLNEIFFRNSEKKYRSGSLLTAGYLIQKVKQFLQMVMVTIYGHVFIPLVQKVHVPPLSIHGHMTIYRNSQYFPFMVIYHRWKTKSSFYRWPYVHLWKVNINFPIMGINLF